MSLLANFLKSGTAPKSTIRSRIRWDWDKATILEVGGHKAKATWGLARDQVNYTLIYDGVERMQFKSLSELKCYLIRRTYDIKAYYAIPSEILADAGMVYPKDVWVDSWFDHMLFRPRLVVEPISRPIHRKLVSGSLPGTPLKPHVRPKFRGEIISAAPVIQKDQVTKKEKSRDPEDLELSWEDQYNLELGDKLGSGLDKDDFCLDEDCFYSLEVGTCAETCSSDLPSGKI